MRATTPHAWREAFALVAALHLHERRPTEHETMECKGFYSRMQILPTVVFFPFVFFFKELHFFPEISIFPRKNKIIYLRKIEIV
jgi:hypothetical protein